jgi:23S rRNA (uracil1939-C5)-methyltransferase
LSTAPSPNQKIQIKIVSLAHGGSGVGRYNDFVIFTPFTCPEDEVLVQIIDVKKNYALARLLEILKPSPKRVTPPCPVFGRCGGCQWQHVSYAEQLKQKQIFVEQSLSRIAKVEGIEVHKIIPSPIEFSYRNRAQFRIEDMKVGFYQQNTHSIVEFDKCLIADDKVNEELRRLKSGEVPKNKDSVDEFGFSQVNTLQNQNMQSYLKEKIGSPVPGKNKVLDLYCGNGNFSFPLNDLGWITHGIDLNTQGILAAKKLERNGTSFITGDVSREVKKLADKDQKFDLVILDPPRIGCDEKLWAHLAKLDAKNLVYVSCDPATFARDWGRLKNKTPYKITSVQPFDMFPQTFHVELVAIAQK